MESFFKFLIVKYLKIIHFYYLTSVKVFKKNRLPFYKFY